jgi:Tol biopolymer transport system component
VRTRRSTVVCACIGVALGLGIVARAAGEPVPSIRAGWTSERAARPKTLVTVHGSVDAVAQGGRRIAWITTHARCGRQVQILTLPGRRPVYIGSRRGGSCAQRGGLFGAIALNGDGRVLWQGLAGFGNTELSFDLFTAAIRAPQTRLVAALGIEWYQGDPDDYQGSSGPRPWLMAAGGRAVLFYALCDLGCNRNREGAVYRLVGRRARRLTKVTNPVGLAVSGRRFAVVTNSFHCCNATPAWSHDGRRLAWIYHGNLWTVNADGTGDRQLAAHVLPPRLEPDAVPRPSWSPDDARLVFERIEAKNGRRGVYRVDASGGGLKRLAAGASPAWSPGGMRIAFVRGKDVYAIDPDGSGERKLTTTARFSAGPLSWSPDSTRIAVSRGGHIFLVRADGRGETRLTTSRHTEDRPTWSPNGAKIAYVDESEASPGIVAVNADGTGATRLTKTWGDRSPAWSPDSKMIAFVRLDDGQAPGALWVMNADGSGRRRLLASDKFVDSPQWAPGGRSILVGDGLDLNNANWPADPALRLVSPVDGKATKIGPLRRSLVEIRDVGAGRSINRFRIDGDAGAVALGPDYVALLVDHHPGIRLELFSLNGSFRRAAAVPASARNLSASDGTVVFATGRVIRRLDAKTGVVSVLATARRTPVGPTIEGRRVVWAEKIRGAAQIRAVTAP